MCPTRQVSEGLARLRAEMAALDRNCVTGIVLLAIVDNRVVAEAGIPFTLAFIVIAKRVDGIEKRIALVGLAADLIDVLVESIALHRL